MMPYKVSRLYVMTLFSSLTDLGTHDSMREVREPNDQEDEFQTAGWGCGAVGSAREWHSRGRRFNPGQLHQSGVS
jgi:hypothetical protein